MFTRNRYDVEDYNRDLYQTIRPGHLKQTFQEIIVMVV